MILLTNMAHGLPYCFYIIMQTVCISKCTCLHVKLTHPLMHARTHSRTHTHTRASTEHPKAIIKNINTIIHKQHDSNSYKGSYSCFTAKIKSYH